MLSNAKKELVLLPRGYLSWTQLSCWKSSKERYRKEYFEKSSKLDTKYLRYGSVIAKLIEDGDHESILPGLPVYDRREYPFDEILDHNGTQVRIIGKLDGFDEPFGIIGEYKTGKTPWTQAKVQKHDQFLFYAVGVELATSMMPGYGDLHWIETVDDTPVCTMLKNTNKVSVTGKIETFTRVFDRRELARMREEIVTIALEISQAYIAYLNEL